MRQTVEAEKPSVDDSFASPPMREPPLSAGRFYWVIPVFDVDFVPPGFEGHDWSDELHEAAWKHWSQQTQPALFLGHTVDGTEKWVYLGQDIDADNWWPVCWIGSAISSGSGGGGVHTGPSEPVTPTTPQGERPA
jgi:hypothetical protein